MISDTYLVSHVNGKKGKSYHLFSQRFSLFKVFESDRKADQLFYIYLTKIKFQDRNTMFVHMSCWVKGNIRRIK